MAWTSLDLTHRLRGGSLREVPVEPSLSGSVDGEFFCSASLRPELLPSTVNTDFSCLIDRAPIGDFLIVVTAASFAGSSPAGLGIVRPQPVQGRSTPSGVELSGENRANGLLAGCRGEGYGLEEALISKRDDRMEVNREKSGEKVGLGDARKDYFLRSSSLPSSSPSLTPRTDTLILLNQVDRHQSSVVTGNTATAPIKASSATFGLPNLRVPKNHSKSFTPAALPASLPSSTNLPPRQFPPGSSSSSITRIPDGPRPSSVHILHAFRIREQVSEKDVCDLFSKDGTASSRILSLYSSALRSPH
jgi:hypothetical protein